MTALIIFTSILYLLDGVLIYFLVDSIFFGMHMWYTTIIILLWPLVVMAAVIYLIIIWLLLLTLKIKRLFRK